MDGMTMPQALRDFRKRKPYLLCVDSDGCAMDTMTVKHIRCFGPCFVEALGITQNTAAVLGRWNEINLYEITRGINRFSGFARLLTELYPKDRQARAFYEWTEQATELSERAVTEAFEATGNPVFEKAVAWSKAVNRAISALPEEDKRAFRGAAEGLAAARENFDIAIVSSANYDAVAEEWRRTGLLQLTDAAATQTDGAKAHCIAELIRKGYDRGKVVMCGDAEGDLLAARYNGVAFYPIEVGRETECWARLPELLDRFRTGGCEEELASLKKSFYRNLRAEG